MHCVETQQIHPLNSIPTPITSTYGNSLLMNSNLMKINQLNERQLLDENFMNNDHSAPLNQNTTPIHQENNPLPKNRHLNQKSTHNDQPRHNSQSKPPPHIPAQIPPNNHNINPIRVVEAAPPMNNELAEVVEQDQIGHPVMFLVRLVFIVYVLSQGGHSSRIGLMVTMAILSFAHQLGLLKKLYAFVKRQVNGRVTATLVPLDVIPGDDTIRVKEPLLETTSMDVPEVVVTENSHSSMDNFKSTRRVLSSFFTSLFVTTDEANH